MTQEIIYSEKNKYKEELLRYFDSIPDYELYELNDFSQVYNIENKNLSEFVKNNLKEYGSTTKGYICKFQNINYIFIISKDILYHEISHLVYREKINSLFVNYEIYKKYIVFIDEVIAECISSKILGKSYNLEEYEFTLKSMRKLNKPSLAYYIGGYLGLKPKNVAFPKDFVTLANKIEKTIVFNKFTLIDIRVNELITIIKSIKQYNLERYN